MKKIFFDTEFTGLHKRTTLISLGIISECGKTFYAEFDDYDRTQIDEWLRDNVIANLTIQGNPIGSEYSVQLQGSTEKIKVELEKWLAQFEKIEVWSDCLAYDWVLFNDIFDHGLPNNVFYIPFDICTLFKACAIDPDISREKFAEMEAMAQKHNALWDALVIKKCYEKLVSLLKTPIV